MSDKIVLIDGHSILNRAFYGLPDLTNSEGLHTNAVYGFLKIMLSILDEEKPQYLAVAFDLSAPTFRHKRYEAYKGTRKPMPEELRQQVPLMKEMLTAMGIPLMMLEGYEADDLIGTVSLACELQGLDVSIISGDRDLLQLASDTTCVRIPKTKRTGTVIENYYTQDVIDAYQVPPIGIIDLKALMGDSSDNIPGIPGVGEKTAGKIIAQYGTIENAYAHLEEIKPTKAKNSLTEHYDLAQLSKELATINRHSPFTLDLEQAKMTDLFTPEAQSMCRRLEFKNLLTLFDGAKAQQEEHFTVLDAAQMEEKLAQVDGEIGLSVLRDDKSGHILALAICMGEEDCFFAEGDAARIKRWIGALADRGIFLSMLDVKANLQFAEQLTRAQVFDAHVAAYLLNPLKGDYPYDDLLREYAGREVPAKEELIDKKKGAEKVLAEDRERAVRYLCYEALAARLTKAPMEEKLRETGMWSLYEEVELPLVFALYDMQKEGIQVQSEQLRAYGEQLQGRITELESKIYAEAGETFNINSPKQLGVLLFEKMQLPFAKKTKTGYSTAADVLDKLAPDYPVVADILEYRQLTKLKSTYADGLYAFIREDGRIHGTFHQTVTATGRLSSADPNLQNIPVRTALGRQFRKVFVPKEGCVFVDADYSQIELRVLAHASNDPQLIKAYNEADDIHAITASQVFHVPLDQVTDQLRRNAKAVNFGIVYGISSFGLGQNLSISREEAAGYIAQYFKTYPGIKAFLDNSVTSAKEKGYCETLFGRRRPVPELKSGNFMQRSFGERVAMNAPIQGTAADIIKIAMVRVHDRLLAEGLRSRLVLQIHDELLVETQIEEKAQVMQILQEEMMGAAHLQVPLEIDMHDGASWYDAH